MINSDWTNYYRSMADPHKDLGDITIKLGWNYGKTDTLLVIQKEIPAISLKKYAIICYCWNASREDYDPREELIKLVAQPVN